MESAFLFQSAAFLQFQGNPQLVSLEEVGGNTYSIAWFEKQQEGFSPVRAPFGSISTTGEWPNQVHISELIKKLEADGIRQKIKSITITHFPNAYQPEFSLLLLNCLRSEGFSIQNQELNFHLDVKEGFKKNLRRSERWKLNKAHREGYYFKKCHPPNWDIAFPLLQNSRERKGYALSMTRDELEAVFAQFPEYYSVYGVFHRSHCVAIGITIRVSPQIEYVFYTADDIQHRKRSPVVLLHEGIYKECQKNGVTLLDLGTASLKGVVNSGVATFKRNLGGIASLKNSFQKRWS